MCKKSQVNNLFKTVNSIQYPSEPQKAPGLCQTNDCGTDHFLLIEVLLAMALLVFNDERETFRFTFCSKHFYHKGSLVVM
jgi:hypothetical protein